VRDEAGHVRCDLDHFRAVRGQLIAV